MDKEVLKQIEQDLSMEALDQYSEKEILGHIADRVERLLRADPDLLMSYLYRLDVEQRKIKVALDSSPFPIHVVFANLIWERQKQRVLSKKKYKQDPIKGWEF